MIHACFVFGVFFLNFSLKIFYFSTIKNQTIKFFPFTVTVYQALYFISFV